MTEGVKTTEKATVSVLRGDWTAATGSEKVTGQQLQEEEEIWNRLSDRREAVSGGAGPG